MSRFFKVETIDVQCQNGEPNVLSWCIPLVMSAMPFGVKKKPDEKE